MGWLDAVTSIVSSVTWPAVVVVAIVLMRQPLRRLVGRLESYEGAGQKISFGKAVEELEVKAEDSIGRSTESNRLNQDKSKGHDDARATVSNHQSAHSYDSVWPSLVQLAKVSGSAAVIESWREVERSLTNLFEKARAMRGGASEARRAHESVNRMLDYLGRIDALSPDKIATIRELSSLRNRAAHTDIMISENEALGYSDLALDVSRAINATEVPSH